MIPIPFPKNVKSLIPRDGLIGEWLFNGSANDTSGYGNNGTVNGATLTTDKKGVSNSAYLFDGTNDFISIPSSQINGLTAISISIWVYPTNIGKIYSSFFMSRGSGTNIIGFAFNATNGAIRVYLAGGTDYIDGGLVYLENNVWCHVMLTWSPVDGFKIYKNNAVTASKTSVSASIIVDDVIKLGADDGIADRWYDGKIDNLRIYDKIISTAQRLALYSELA
jgi:hypothetical protein